jgi:hypothetical protein
MPRNRNVMQVFPVNLENDDVCTVISIVPFLISEFKPGIYPGRFVINPCLDFKKPEVLVVGTSVHFISQFNGDDELPSHVVKTISKEIAECIVKDYMSGQMDVDPNCHPGLTWVPGKVSSSEFVVKYAGRHTDLQKKQLTWFGKLVQRADNDWNRYKNHMVVSNNQKFAARALGLEREWLIASNIEVPIKCTACLSNCDPAAIICMNCRFVLKPEEYKKLTFAA